MGEIQPLYKRVLFGPEEVDAAIGVMAEDIVTSPLYPGKKPLLLGLMEGAKPTLLKLRGAIRSLGEDYPTTSITTSKYGSGRDGTKKPRITTGIPPGISMVNRHVIIVDDVLDTGETAGLVTEYVNSLGVSAVSLCVLVEKNLPRTADNWPSATFAGFRNLDPDEWLTGMGMDDARIAPDANRNLPFIAIAND